MKLLAFDTSTEACSAALYIDGEITSLYEIAPQRHAELILPMVDQVLSQGQVKLTDLDAIAFGRGPGSFTGVRIATGIAQGLAFSADLPLIPVSSLAALAQSVKDEADYIAAAIDARMGEIYFGLYKSGDNVELVGEETVIAPAKLEISDMPVCYGIGTGWASYTGSLKVIFKDKLKDYAGDRYPHAKDLAILAVDACRKGVLTKPENAAPVYLRDKVTG
jgi:tRNA threonylcarbamoyladenosine biosynthesis protein TsaB